MIYTSMVPQHIHVCISLKRMLSNRRRELKEQIFISHACLLQIHAVISTKLCVY